MAQEVGEKHQAVGPKEASQGGEEEVGGKGEG